MNRFRRLLVPALAAAVLVTAAVGCGARTDSSSAVRDAVDALTGVNLGPIPVHIDEQGRITRVAGFNTSLVDGIAESLINQPIIGRIPVFSQRYLEWFMRSNVQHITIASRKEGLFVLVNGEPLPYVAWDEDSMNNLVDVLGMFVRDGKGTYLVSADNYSNLKAILPALPKLNLEVDLVLPKAAGAETVPMPGRDAFDRAMETVGERSPLDTVDLTVEYKPLTGANGEDLGWVPSALGVSTVDLRQALSTANMTVPHYRLRRDIEARMKAEGVSQIGIQARQDGVFIVVDEMLLPHLAWSDRTLTNLSTLLDQLYPPKDDNLLPKADRWVPLVRSAAPLFNDFDVALQVKFPVGGAAPQ